MFKNTQLPTLVIDRSIMHLLWNTYADFTEWVKDHPNQNMLMWQPMEWAPYMSSWGMGIDDARTMYSTLKETLDSIGSEVIWTFGSTDHAMPKIIDGIIDQENLGHRDGSHDNTCLENLDADVRDVILIQEYFTVTYDPFWFLTDSMLNVNDSVYQPLPHGQPEWFNELLSEPIDKVFTCINRGPWIHRAVMLDHLAKHKLIDSNIVSWNEEYITNENGLYSFRWWDQKIINVDAHKQRNDPAFTSVTDGHHISYGRIPNQSVNTLIDVINESSPMFYFYTEKTWKSIFRGRPFLIVGPKGVNKYLENAWGFKLFHEIIDYSFDDLDSYDERCNAIALQLKALGDKDLKQLQTSVADTILHNFETAQRIHLDQYNNVTNDFITEALHNGAVAKDPNPNHHPIHDGGKHLDYPTRFNGLDHVFRKFVEKLKG